MNRNALLVPLAPLCAMFASRSNSTAQTLTVVPASYAQVDAASRTVLVTNQPERIQLVIDAAEHGLAAPATITELRLRRDATLAETLPSAAMQLVVRIGHADRLAANAMADYATNARDLAEVFRGTLSAPTSTVPAILDWSVDQTLRIPLTTSFAYRGGGLVVDIESTPTGAGWWPIDAFDDSVGGSLHSVGAPCGAFASWPQTAWASESGLVLGRTARVSMRGQPGSAAMLLVSNAVLTTPINMTPLGAPGCLVHVLPFAVVPSFVRGIDLAPGAGGPAWVDLHIPSDPTLAGANLATQWMEITMGGLAFTNALDLTLGTAPPSLGIARVSAPTGSPPRVTAEAIPVLGLMVH